MPFNPKADDQYDFYIVMEATSPEGRQIQNLQEVKDNGLNFLRFSACLQDFNGYNRNRRKWTAQIIKTMSEAPTVQELIHRGSFVGEQGHPVPSSGKVSVERIMNIDPDRTSHRIVKLFWPKPNEIHGIVETLDEGPGSPGDKMKRNILQGVQPAFSLRSLVPQRRNADGTIDVIGPGRMICYDRVYLPSHEGAYMDVDVPVKSVVTKSEFETVMESFTEHVMAHSDKIRTIVDKMEPAMESATLDTKTGLIGVNTKEGRVLIAPETRYFEELRGSLSDF